MKDQIVNRRSLIGALILSSSTLAMGSTGMSLRALLRTSDGEEAVRSIIGEHFTHCTGKEKAISEFYQSLLLGQDHTEKQEFFLELLDSKALDERLSLYVIQEFAISTNYMGIVDGQETVLRMLKS